VRTTSLPLCVLFTICGVFAGGCGGPGAANDAPNATGGNDSFGGNGGSGGVVNLGGTSAGGNDSGTGGSSVANGTQTSGGETSVGGTTTSGGSTSAGGTVSSGGTKASTVTSVTGGATSTPLGGATSTGGSVAAGGTKAGGGTVSTGGTAAIGGTKAGGGTTSTIGTKTTGGTTSLGGSTSAGGTQAVGGNTSTSLGCTPPTTYPNLFVTLSAHTQAESDTKVAAAWSKLFNPSGSGNIYFNGPGSDESYVKDIASGDVRTEGMSYGMMVAVQLDHQTEFDRLWKWVRNHMAQNCTSSGCTGEIAWHCSESGSKLSTGGAPDGEEYFATALIFAHNRWGDTTGVYNYAIEAQWVLDLIRTKYFNTTYHIVRFVSGSNNTDGSYVLPAFYQVWACFDTANAAFWDAAVTAGRDFFHNAMDSNGVIPDQSSFTGGTVVGANADWIRCVMNIMMDYNFFKADPWQADTYATKFGAYEKSQNRYTAQMSCDALLGFGLPASSGKPFVDKLWSASIPSGNYWDGVLYMLGMLHVSGTFKLWY
jgi:oligosaccharide reducing-end xylanase